MVGQRVARLRASHGESLREAAYRTGVSHTTIARIEKGEVTGSFHSTLKKIAEGYGVRVEYLLTGRDPRQDFEFSVRRLSPEERSKLYFVSPKARIKMVLDFMAAEYGSEFSMDLVLRQASLEGLDFQTLLDHWNASDMPEDVYLRVAEALSRLTGIGAHWFQWGALEEEAPAQVSPDTVTAYVELMKKAAKNNIQPDMLDMAIDLLIMKQREPLMQ